jgi:hypothetical protein
MAMIEDFVVFILSHGRPDRIDTLKSLEKSGYTGKYYIVVDNEDKTTDEYYRLYGEKVIMFDKAAIAETFDEGDNSGDRRSVVYARNACFDIARELGVTYFMELDDDYIDFRYKMDGNFDSIHKKDILNLDVIIEYLLEYYKSIPAVSIAIAQGGDFLGGLENDIHKSLNRRRKCMNTFICSTDRPFRFVGRINEDVNTYTWYQSLGNLFLTFPLIAIQQRQSQSNSGGMTELYLDSGTYIKSFFTLLYNPSGTKIKAMRSRHPRLHHQISWDHTVPAIIREEYRKDVTGGVPELVE